MEAADALREEAAWAELDEQEACDNVDLPLVLMEYQNFYQVRCQD